MSITFLLNSVELKSAFGLWENYRYSSETHLRIFWHVQYIYILSRSIYNYNQFVSVFTTDKLYNLLMCYRSPNVLPFHWWMMLIITDRYIWVYTEKGSFSNIFKQWISKNSWHIQLYTANMKLQLTMEVNCKITHKGINDCDARCF